MPTNVQMRKNASGNKSSDHLRKIFLPYSIYRHYNKVAFQKKYPTIALKTVNNNYSD